MGKGRNRDIPRRRQRERERRERQRMEEGMNENEMDESTNKIKAIFSITKFQNDIFCCIPFVGSKSHLEETAIPRNK